MQRLVLFASLLFVIACHAQVCEVGIPNSAGTVCCPDSCGVCGGEDCAALPGGSSSCCASRILATQQVCGADHPPPCVIGTSESAESADPSAAAAGGSSSFSDSSNGGAPAEVVYPTGQVAVAAAVGSANTLVSPGSFGLVTAVLRAGGGDPLCLFGVLSKDRTLCCPAECTDCGGDSCAAAVTSDSVTTTTPPTTPAPTTTVAPTTASVVTTTTADASSTTTKESRADRRRRRRQKAEADSTAATSTTPPTPPSAAPLPSTPPPTTAGATTTIAATTSSPLTSAALSACCGAVSDRSCSTHQAPCRMDPASPPSPPSPDDWLAVAADPSGCYTLPRIGTAKGEFGVLRPNAQQRMPLPAGSAGQCAALCSSVPPEGCVAFTYYSGHCFLIPPALTHNAANATLHAMSDASSALMQQHDMASQLVHTAKGLLGAVGLPTVRDASGTALSALRDVSSPSCRVPSFSLAANYPSLPILDAPPLKTAARAARVSFGCGDVNVGALSEWGGEETYRTSLVRHCDYLTAALAMKWAHMSANDGSRGYDFAQADALVDFAERHGLGVRGHTTVWYRDLPQWVEEEYRRDTDPNNAPVGGDASGNLLRQGTALRRKWEAILVDHVRTVVSRYAGRVFAWDVVNEPMADDGSGLRRCVWLDMIGPSYVELAFRTARQADPSTLLFLNDYSVELFSWAKSTPYYDLAARLAAQGILDGVGLQTHLRLDNAVNEPGFFGDLAANLQRFAALGLQVHLTEVDVRMAPPASPDRLKLQGKAYRLLTDTAMANGVSSVALWGLSDVPRFSFLQWENSAGGVQFVASQAFGEGWEAKPAYHGMMQSFAVYAGEGR